MADLEVGQSGYGYDARAFENMPNDLIRQGFVRKVYTTLAVQLGVTAILAAPIAQASDAWLDGHRYLMMLSMLGLLVFCGASLCGGLQMFRTHPRNLLVLTGFTLCESVLLGFTCAMYEVRSLVLCFGMTAVMIAVLTIFASTTKIDITHHGHYLRAGLSGLLAMGILSMICGLPLLYSLYTYLGAVVFAAYLVYDTQLILGGKHQHCRFGVDDYAFAALSVYLDMIRLPFHLANGRTEAWQHTLTIC